MSDREQADANRDALIEEARALGATKREAERAVKRREAVPYVWRGHARYRCPLCPVDRDTAAEIDEHIATNHPPDEPSELQQMTGAAVATPEPEAAAAATEDTSDATGNADGAEHLGGADDGADGADAHRRRSRER